MLRNISFKVTLGILKCRIPVPNIAFRYVRSIARRQPVDDSIKTLKGKVRTEYDSKLDDDFMHVKDLKALKRMISDVFVKTDETQTVEEYDMEENYDAPIEHAEKFYDMNLEEEKMHKRMVKKKIVMRKYFKEPRETGLLTYAAKMQIRHLHELDPIKWTHETLAESFPISVAGVKKLLKSNYIIDDEERIKQHDADVAQRWKLLESGNTESISPVTVQLYMEGKITKDHHAGNFTVSSPKVQNSSISNNQITESKPKKIGEHAAMIQYYLDLKQKSDTKEVTLPANNADTDLKVTHEESLQKGYIEIERKDIQKTVLPEFKSRYPSRKEMVSMQSASYLTAAKPDEEEIEITQAQFEENLVDEFSAKHPKSKSSIDTAYEEWLQKQISEKSKSSGNKPQPYDCSDFFETIKKFSGDTIELHTDKNNAVLYDEHLGYQYPLGKEVIRRYVKIPKEKYIPGALYRVGKHFYADDGEFLFKVCVPIKK